MSHLRTSIKLAPRWPMLAALGLLLVSCATTPVFEGADANLALQPSDVQQDDIGFLGELVIWGGVILKTENLAQSTRIEVMAYPLDSSRYPDRDEEALGRFVLFQQGFLEPLSYAEGRSLTVLGKLRNNHPGKVGDSDYVFPVVNSTQLKLWPVGGPPRTTFHFGIGISL